MAIWFDIDPKSGAPLFKQIIEQVRRAVATGMLKPDERLPTVRELAEEHSINPNTIAKAYQHLESMGLVYTRPGVRGGTFVASGIGANLRELELSRYQEDLRRMVRDGYTLGLNAHELDKLFEQVLDEWYSAHPPPGPVSLEEPGEDTTSTGLINRGARKLYTAGE
jgi:GntR family transcriptional regulator